MKNARLYLILLALIALTPTAWAQGLSGSGTTDDPYLITSADDWNTFAQSVTNDSTYAGQTVKLTADIYVTEMVGLYRAFSGTLDGDGHTITLALSGSGEGTALFYWIENATLKNLKAQGTVTTTDRRPATFAVIVNGNSTISNCWSTVAVSSTRTSGWVDGGGFVGRVSSNATLNMTDCAFHGSVTFTEGATTGGGMVGYTQSNATVNLTNCLYSPTSLTLNVSEYNPRVFVSGSVEGNLNNCYYNAVAAASVLGKQGTDASDMTNEALAEALGAGWHVYNNMVVPFTGTYYISSAAEWNAFATTVNNGTSYSGQTVALTTDIPTAEEIANGTNAVTTMAGTDSHPFCGTFDGDGHTITLALSGSGPGTALFYLIEGATLKNLKVQGTVTTSEYRPATFAAFVEGDCTISNCWSTVAVSSTRTSGWVDGGGFVGRVSSNATLNMAGCAFHGSVTFTPTATTGGGMVGFTQTGAVVNLTDCLYSPTTLTLNVSQYNPRIFVSGDVAGNLTNCYYNDVAADSELGKQGKLMHSITAGDYVTVAFDGEATTYDMSGISAYNVGLVYDSTLYAGQGETVSLNLACTPPPGYTYGSFSASAGTLNGTENPYTLTMPNEDVTIVPGYIVSVVCTPNIAGAAQVSLDNTNWSSSVNAAVGQVVYFKANDVIGYRRAGYTIETENGELVDFANGHFTMPAANVTYYADFSLNPFYLSDRTVTLSSGEGTGTPIVYAFNPETTALDAASADTCQFYYVNNNTLGFRLPHGYCPSSFTAPYGGTFLGWDGGSNDGYTTLTSTATTFAAQWLYRIVTLSPGLVGGEPIVYTFNSETVAPNAAAADICQFYYVDYNTLGFRLPNDYLPNSFIEPYEGAFLGWDGWSNDGYITLTSTTTTFTAQWNTYVVTLSPGLGEGEPIFYTFIPETTAPNAATADTFQFYYMYNDVVGFRLPYDYCPNSFTAPDGLGFSGWNNSGYVTLTSRATTFTAQWGTPGIPVNYIDENGEMHTCNSYTVLTGNELTLDAGWYVVYDDITYSNDNGDALTLSGDVTLILCNGKTMTVTPESGRGIEGFEKTLTVYGQSLDSIVAGILNVIGDGSNDAISLYNGTYTQHSGNVVVRYSGGSALSADCFTINGGSLEASGKNKGIVSDNLTINGGTVTATFTSYYYVSNSGLASNGNVIINGGKVEASSIWAGQNITLGYTHADDYILAGEYSYNYYNNNSTVSVKSGQTFYYVNEGENVIVSGTLNQDQIDAIRGKTLRPRFVNYMDGNGEMHICTDFTVLTGNETTLEAGWYAVDHDITYDSTLTLNGDVTLILCNGKTMTVTTDSGKGIVGLMSNLTLYSQSLDSIVAGTLNVMGDGSNTAIDLFSGTYTQHSGNVVVSNSGGNALQASHIIMYGGSIHVSSGWDGIVAAMTINGGSINANGSNFGIVAANMTINGGSIHANGGDSGINAYDLTINGGTVIANSNQNHDSHSGLLIRGNLVINGGKVEASSIWADGNITLGWTNTDDYILAGSYGNASHTISVKSGQAFYYEEVFDIIVSGTLNTIYQIRAIEGKTLRPYIVPTTVTKDIAGYGTGDGGWQLIALPMYGTINPTTINNLIANNVTRYDLYRFEPSHEGNEWENYKADSTFKLEVGKGYLYANKNNVTLTFSGPAYIGDSCEIALVYDSTDYQKCWNLVGNPFDCNATLDREYYVLDESGLDINPEPIPATTPVPPCTAVFVKAVSDGDRAVFTRVTQ